MLNRVFVLIYLLLLPFFSFSGKKKGDSDFQKNFNIAKQHLSQREISEALPYLMYLHDKYPNNANLKYLIGVCYAENEIVNPKTLELLNSATEKVSLNYNPNSLEEERVPIYVYYYLSVAYSQNKMCEQAEKARNQFLELYTYNDTYYIDESLKWIDKCKGLKEIPKNVPLPEFPDFKPYVSPSPKKITAFKPVTEHQVEKEQKKLVNQVQEETEVKEKKIVTKKIEYSTQRPLYGVQLGAFKEVVPVSRFKNMKNVDAFMDKSGLIRYVVGHFSFYSQAESLLKIIKEKGFTDAFVVDVNSEKKYEDEIVSVNNININYDPSIRTEYRVQVGAFRKSLPDRAAFIYTQVEGIKEYKEGGTTYLTVGKFKSYGEAKVFSQEIIDAGIADAFVIALSGGKKVSLQQVNEFNN